MYTQEEFEREFDALPWQSADFMKKNNPKDDPLLYRIHLHPNPYSISSHREGILYVTPLMTEGIGNYLGVRCKLPAIYDNVPRINAGFISVFKSSENNTFFDDDSADVKKEGIKLNDIEGPFIYKERHETPLIPTENPRIAMYIFRNKASNKRKFGFLSNIDEIEISPITADSKIYKMLQKNCNYPSRGFIDLSDKYEPNWINLDFKHNQDMCRFVQEQAHKKQEVYSQVAPDKSKEVTDKIGKFLSKGRCSNND